GEVTVTLPSGTTLLAVEVLDMLGHVVLRSSGEDRTLHLQHLASGVYSLRLFTTAGESMVRVVRE
ncbi:MAG TPA: T9SS type A sorting domain-containing protein, partial [Flavobacteriales bacterium]|nr:T9SS type A sorting domain-containing protein [Flavobacteriales bacterium]